MKMMTMTIRKIILIEFMRSEGRGDKTIVWFGSVVSLFGLGKNFVRESLYKSHQKKSNRTGLN